MKKLFKPSALFLLLSAPGAFAGTTICEFNNPNTGTTPGCWARFVAGGPNGNVSIYDVIKDGHSVVGIWKEHNYNGFCSVNLTGSSGSQNDEYSVVVLSTDNNCAWYRVESQ